MAEEKKKESKGSKRYGGGPKIKDAAQGDADKGGHEEGASKAAKKTAGAPEPKAATGTDEGPTGTEDAGTEDIPVRHQAEMKEMYGRQRKEMSDMGARHRDEHKKMTDRHANEMYPDKGESDKGTEP